MPNHVHGIVVIDKLTDECHKTVSWKTHQTISNTLAKSQCLDSTVVKLIQILFTTRSANSPTSSHIARWSSIPAASDNSRR